MGTSAKTETLFQQILQRARDDDDVLGLVLTGSRGRGFANAYSDYDCALIVKDEALSAYESEFSSLPDSVELSIFTLGSFRSHAAWGSDLAWDRYTWAHLVADPDKTGGEIQRLVDEKSSVPEKHARAFVEGSLDGYVNRVYRSFKAHRAGDYLSYQLEAAESIPPLLRALFCLHGRRVAPYYKYLRWELEKDPLTKLSISSDELLEHILTIIQTGDYKGQQVLLREAERIARLDGFGRVFDDWSGKDRWAMDYEPPG